MERDGKRGQQASQRGGGQGGGQDETICGHGLSLPARSCNAGRGASLQRFPVDFESNLSTSLPGLTRRPHYKAPRRTEFGRLGRVRPYLRLLQQEPVSAPFKAIVSADTMLVLLSRAGRLCRHDVETRVAAS